MSTSTFNLHAGCQKHDRACAYGGLSYAPIICAVFCPGAESGAAATAAATALALLHLWDVDAAVDSQLWTLLSELQLLQLPQDIARLNGQAGSAAGRQRQCLHQPDSARPTQLLPAVIAHGCASVAVPSGQQAGAEPLHQQRRDESQQLDVLALLEHSPILVAQRMLALAAVSKRMLAFAQLSEAAVSPTCWTSCLWSEGHLAALSLLECKVHPQLLEHTCITCC